MRILITSGGTKIPIDRVRHIANMSSGTFGSKIALEALKKDHGVAFFYAENSKTPFTYSSNLFKTKNSAEYIQELVRLEELKFNLRKYANLQSSTYDERTYSNFDTYVSGLKEYIDAIKPDVIVLAAAVSDYGIDNYVDGKIRSKDSDMVIKLKALPKVISQVKSWAPKAYLVGFKLLVDSTDEELIENAKKSIETNGCNMVVANDLRDIKNNDHKLIIVKPNKEPWMYYSNHALEANVLAQAVIREIEMDFKL
jgi:phosphopantothenate--cysteine ligase